MSINEANFDPTAISIPSKMSPSIKFGGLSMLFPSCDIWTSVMPFVSKIKKTNRAKIKNIYVTPYATDPVKSRRLNYFFFTTLNRALFLKPKFNPNSFFLETHIFFALQSFVCLDHQNGQNTRLKWSITSPEFPKVEVAIYSEFTIV